MAIEHASLRGKRQEPNRPLPTQCLCARGPKYAIWHPSRDESDFDSEADFGLLLACRLRIWAKIANPQSENHTTRPHSRARGEPRIELGTFRIFGIGFRRNHGTDPVQRQYETDSNRLIRDKELKRSIINRQKKSHYIIAWMRHYLGSTMGLSRTVRTSVRATWSSVEPARPG